MSVNLYGDLRGWRGTARTIREMDRLVKEGRADPTVIFLAEQLARKKDKRDYTGQLEEIFDWIRKNIHYVRDPRDVEFIRSPLYTMYYRAGDCDDQVILFSALAEAIGFKTRFKTIKANSLNTKEFSHVYAQALVPGHGWVCADTIVDRATLGWEAPGQFGAHTWEDGVGMMGLGGLGQEAAPVAAPRWWEPLANVFGNIAVSAANIVGQKAVNDLSKNVGIPTVQQQQATQLKAKQEAAMMASLLPGKVPGWLIPLVLVGGAVSLGSFVFMKKHRR